MTGRGSAQSPVAKPPNSPTTRPLLMKAASTAGIPKERGVLWNRLRHTWATRVAATGEVSLFEISKLMGNSVTICEKHYAAYVPAAHRRLAGLLDPKPIVPGDVAESRETDSRTESDVASYAGSAATTHPISR